MKTNKSTNYIIVILAILAVCLFSVTAFADTGDQNSTIKEENTETVSEAPADPEKPGSEEQPTDAPEQSASEDQPKGKPEKCSCGNQPKNRPEKSGRGDQPNSHPEMPGRGDQPKDRPEMPGRGNQPNSRPEKPGFDRHGDRFEDWFEDRIDRHEHHVDFSQLPEKPTDQDMIDFFRMNFTGKGPDGEKGPKPMPRGDQPKGHPKKNEQDRAADRFEDWFEDRIEQYKDSADFSELPENPTDEDMIGFFTKYFMNKGEAADSEPLPAAEQPAEEATEPA